MISFLSIVELNVIIILRERSLREQQESSRRQKERSEKERVRLEQERRKEKEEEDALEQVMRLIAS